MPDSNQAGNLPNFHRVGADVKIYERAVIVAPENITLGSHIIIDDFVFIGAHRKIILGNYVHVASHASITGGGRVLVCDFCGISSGARLVSGTDDFTGGTLTGPTIPPQFRHSHRGAIILEPHVIIGSNAVVLPDVTIGEGSTVGAGSVVTHSLEPWGVYAGAPARRINTRPRDALHANAKLLFETCGTPEIQYRSAAALEAL